MCKNDHYLKEGWYICGRENQGREVMLVIQERSKVCKAIGQSKNWVIIPREVGSLLQRAFGQGHDRCQILVLVKFLWLCGGWM